MKNKLIEEHELPEIFQNIIDMFENSCDADDSLDFSFYSPSDFYGSPECLWCDEIFSIVLEKGKLGISFNEAISPTLSATLIQFFMKNNYDLDIYESFFFHNGELLFDSEDGKMYFNEFLN